MPQAAKAKQQKRKPAVKGTTTQRPGLPAASSIQSVEKFRSPKGKVYRIIRTNETDADETPAPSTPRRKRKS